MANRASGKQPRDKKPAAPLVLMGNHSSQLNDGKTKFELCGVAQLEKKVASSIKCGRIYLPLDWVGKRVKIIRMD